MSVKCIRPISRITKVKILMKTLHFITFNIKKVMIRKNHLIKIIKSFQTVKCISNNNPKMNLIVKILIYKIQIWKIIKECPIIN